MTDEQQTGSGSPERVAFDLMHLLRKQIEPGESRADTVKATLDLYAECLAAAKGTRSWKPGEFDDF